LAVRCGLAARRWPYVHRPPHHCHHSRPGGHGQARHAARPEPGRCCIHPVGTGSLPHRPGREPDQPVAGARRRAAGTAGTSSCRRVRAGGFAAGRSRQSSTNGAIDTAADTPKGAGTNAANQTRPPAALDHRTAAGRQSTSRARTCRDLRSFRSSLLPTLFTISVAGSRVFMLLAGRPGRRGGRRAGRVRGGAGR
jgi:hypothetical protein